MTHESGLDPVMALRALCNPATSEPDRWLLRVTLLELAGIQPTFEAIAVIGGCSVDYAAGAVAGALLVEGLVEAAESDR